MRSWLREPVRLWVKNICRIIFVVYLGWQLFHLWRLAGDRSRSLVEPILTASVREFVMLILVAMPWVLDVAVRPGDLARLAAHADQGRRRLHAHVAAHLLRSPFVEQPHARRAGA